MTKVLLQHATRHTRHYYESNFDILYLVAAADEEMVLHLGGYLMKDEVSLMHALFQMEER